MKTVCGLIFWLALMPPSISAASNEMVELEYRDQDGDTAAYRTRVLVTASFMRLDYGGDKDDYVLLDRKKNSVYNVTHERREVMRIVAGAPVVSKPAQWEMHEEVRPAALGKNARVVKLFVNGVRCSEVTAQPNLLPDAVAALKQYRAVLAQVQSETFAQQPEAQREFCELAQHVFATSRELDYGLPLAERYNNGRTRELQQYKWRPGNPALFQLPNGYRQFDLRGTRDSR